MDCTESTLIDLVQQFPVIWNKKDSGYNDKIAVENAWLTISQVCELPVTDCQNLWQSLRLKYLRERKKIQELPSGSGAYSCSWPYYNKLGFLDVIKMRKTKSSMLSKTKGSALPGPSTVWDTELTLSNDNGEEVNEEPEVVSSPTFSQSSLQLWQATSPSTQVSNSETERSEVEKENIRENASNLRRKINFKDSKRRKKDSEVEILMEKCSSIGNSLNAFLENEKRGNDLDIDKEDYHFAISVAQSLNSIKSKKKKLVIKSKILLLVADEGFSENEKE